LNQQDVILLSIMAFFIVIYLLLPTIIYGAFWTIIFTFPVCLLMFILGHHSERKKLTKKHKQPVPEELHIVEAEGFGLIIFGNAVPLILLWLITLIPIQILQDQELMLPSLILFGIFMGGGNFEILGESTAKFLFFRE
jgi:hypothetical protein